MIPAHKYLKKNSPPLSHPSPLYEGIGVEVKKIKAGFIISDLENP